VQKKGTNMKTKHITLAVLLFMAVVCTVEAALYYVVRDCLANNQEIALKTRDFISATWFIVAAVIPCIRIILLAASLEKLGTKQNINFC
jgi:heme/copper-type cytochrome/quinol oxidase subunit 2